MNKFNLPRRNIQKERRQKRAERKKQQSKSRAAPAKESVESATDGSTALALKVSSSQHVPYMSGKRRAKLQKKWRRAQKEAIQSGLVTMEDIEMMTGEAEASAEDSADGSTMAPSKPMKKKFSMKKRAKLRLKTSSAPSQQAPVEDAGDAMVQ
jgi:hypothetical protein